MPPQISYLVRCKLTLIAFACLFSDVSFQMSPQSTRITTDIDLTFLHCVLSNVISNFLNEQRKTLLCVFQVVPQVACSKGCIITLVASIDFSPLCDFKCILKLAGQVDAKLHWLHLFDLSPLCLFKSHWMHWFSFSPLRFHLRPQVSCLILCILAMLHLSFVFPLCVSNFK